ncbi:pyridoxamine 5'-phosphate oxidase family protein [Streptomyces sp. NBC_00341]|uniref:pyridoxamine 5'-phosphate oxidase family protein n=1 Tax=Streptomyces sp. NBC_00341 TaxID=2975717 RepID=UPI003084BEDF|nr:pyridoxamine 5'-phosphate oxidase family protein [Streptomyces sp. NBC_00341]
MSAAEPHTELDPRYSSPGAEPARWADAREILSGAELYWLTTVRPDGRPHVTPLIGVWSQGALYFSTGAEERKGRNLAANAEVVLTTGANTWTEGFDVVLEGRAERVTDAALLTALAQAWEAKYGKFWHFDVADGMFVGAQGNRAEVFAVSPRTVFGFGKGERFTQTRWRFA